MAADSTDRLPCITYFYAKGDERPKTGFEPEEPGLTPLTPIRVNIETGMIWGQVSATGALIGAVGVASVTRTSLGTYDVVFDLSRRNRNYVVSRFGDDSVPFYPRQGTYANIESKTTKSFTIKWYNRSQTLIDVAFVFGVYA